MFKLENIYKHLKTSGLAIVIFLVSMLFVWFEKASFSEVWPAWLAVLGFFFYGKPPTKNRLKDISKGAALLLIMFTLNSCTPQKRIQRIVKHHPELERIIVDTVHFHAQVITHADTQAQALNIQALDTLLINDTIYLPGEKYNVYIHKHHTDSFIITVEGKPDTVFIDKTIITKHKNIQITPKAPNEFKNFLIYGILFIGALMALFVIIKAYQK